MLLAFVNVYATKISVKTSPYLYSDTYLGFILFSYLYSDSCLNTFRGSGVVTDLTTFRKLSNLASKMRAASPTRDKILVATKHLGWQKCPRYDIKVWLKTSRRSFPFMINNMSSLVGLSGCSCILFLPIFCA